MIVPRYDRYHNVVYRYLLFDQSTSSYRELSPLRIDAKKATPWMICFMIHLAILSLTSNMDEEVKVVEIGVQVELIISKDDVGARRLPNRLTKQTSKGFLVLLPSVSIDY